MKLKDHKNGFHHFYLGLLILGLAFLLTFEAWFPDITLLILYIAGLWIILDDIYKHFIHRVDPFYRSPLHRLGVYFIRQWAWAGRLLKYLDKLFGRR